MHVLPFTVTLTSPPHPIILERFTRLLSVYRKNAINRLELLTNRGLAISYRVWCCVVSTVIDHGMVSYF